MCPNICSAEAKDQVRFELQHIADGSFAILFFRMAHPVELNPYEHVKCVQIYALLKQKTK